MILIGFLFIYSFALIRQVEPRLAARADLYINSPHVQRSWGSTDDRHPTAVGHTNPKIIGRILPDTMWVGIET
ncbi:hypothetical protein EDB82DRAFT_267547 [Fusarium venenatum]|uniref:uncharacterized protein n=1 Tax=Fusarium venenatum TaxID=56646 RepID=UPI001D66E080|nr:hypothetical protein EDB82DRAFT_267547 [Fusarium venenatum]